ncbi:RNA polymerase sigma factor [Georgenia wutianyii]|uniref:RNA polymerase sigma factor n=1 Tax=Georgenia wutianyii TaxID=2585135 RepID=A0ABX5VJ14_9MICO|nr:RNA polymerase sigma factor [Georgenia wutianyii]QDB78377.1 RNA polymerase sigma factor [Georgenia wutianyii]
MPAPPSADGWEAALVAQARDGNESAFETLVRRHQDRAYLVALRITGHPQNAQDAVQDALLNAWKGLPRHRSESSFGTWLIRIVINRCHNQRRAARPITALPDDEPMSGPGPESEVVAAHRQDATMRAMAALPFDQRTALVLHTFNGCTHAEAGRILGISENAAKVRVHRARRTLTARLQGWR